MHVDTSTSAGRAFFGMLAVFAAFETDVRRERQERQAECIANAERAGVKTASIGRKSLRRIMIHASCEYG